MANPTIQMESKIQNLQLSHTHRYIYIHTHTVSKILFQIMLYDDFSQIVNSKDALWPLSVNWLLKHSFKEWIYTYTIFFPIVLSFSSIHSPLCRLLTHILPRKRRSPNLPKNMFEWFIQHLQSKIHAITFFS